MTNQERLELAKRLSNEQAISSLNDRQRQRLEFVYRMQEEQRPQRVPYAYDANYVGSNSDGEMISQPVIEERQPEESQVSNFSVNMSNILERLKQGQDTHLMQEYLAQGKKELDNAYYEKRIQELKDAEFDPLTTEGVQKAKNITNDLKKTKEEYYNLQYESAPKLESAKPVTAEKQTDDNLTDRTVNLKNVLNRQKQGQDTSLMQEYLAQGKKELDNAYYEKRIQELNSKLPKYDFSQNWSSDPVEEKDPQAVRDTSVELKSIIDEYRNLKYGQRTSKAEELLNTNNDVKKRIQLSYEVAQGNYGIKDKNGKEVTYNSFAAKQNKGYYYPLFEKKKQEAEEAKQWLSDKGYDVDTLLDVYASEQNAQQRQKAGEMQQDLARENPALATAVSWAANTLGALGAPEIGMHDPIQNSIKELQTGELHPVDPNSPYYNAIHATDTMRETVSEDMDGLELFFYQTGLSLADCLAIMPLDTFGVVLMGNSSASRAALNVAEHGGSATQALWTGAAAGAAEVFFEKVSFDQLKAFKKSNKTGLIEGIKNIAKGMFTEGSEEAATDVANLVSDALINADNSDFNRSVQDYEKQGLSKEDAWKRAAIDTISNIGLDFAGGALSGAVLSAGATALNVADTARFGSDIKKGRSEFTLEDLTGIGKTTDPQSRAYQLADKLIKRQEQGKRIGNYQAGALFRENILNRGNFDDVLRGISLKETEGDLLNQGLQSGDDTQAYKLASLMQEKQEQGQAVSNRERVALEQAVNEASAQDIALKKKLEADPEAFSAYLAEYKNTSKNGVEAKNTVQGKTTLPTPETTASGVQGTRAKVKTKNAAGTLSTTVAYGKELQHIQEIAGTEDGRVKVTLSSGKTVGLDRVAVASEETRAVYSMAANFDKAGANAFVDHYKGNLPAENYADGFQAFYLAGRQGRSLEAFSERFPQTVSVMGQESTAAAYRAGVRDQAALLQIRQENAARFKTEGSSRMGIFQVDADRKKLTGDLKAQLEILQGLSDHYGVNIRVVDSESSESGDFPKQANGIYRGNGNIVVDINADAGAVAAVAFHEIGHYINEHNPEGFRALSDFAVQYLEKQEGYDIDERIAALQKATREQTGRWISETDALEEIVCNSLSSIASDSDAINAALQLTAKKRRTLSQVLRDFAQRLKEIFSDYAQANKEAAHWKDSLEDIMELARLLEESADTAKKTETPQKGEMEKYTLKRTLDMSYENQLDAFFSNDKGQLKNADTICVMKQSPVLAKYGFEDLPVALLQSNLRKILRESANNKNKSFHDIPQSFIENLPEYINRPAMVMLKQDRVTLFTDQFVENKSNGNSEPVIIGLQVNKRADAYDIHEIKSIYGLRNIEVYLVDQTDSGAKLFLENKEKADKLLSKAGLQLPGRQAIYDLISNTCDSPPGGGILKPSGPSTNTESINSIVAADNSVKTNTEIDRLKYSLRETAEFEGRLNEQEDQAVQKIDSLVARLFQETGKKQADIQALRRVGKKILKEYQSSYSLNTFVENYQKIFDYMANSGQVDYRKAIRLCTGVAKAILEKSESLDTSMRDQYSGFLREMREKRISLSDLQKEELAHGYGSYRAGRNRLMGKVIVSDNGIPLDTLWRELCVKYPELFDYDTNEAQQVFRLIEVFDSLKPQMKNEFEGNIDEASAELAYRLYDEYFSVPELKTEAQKQNNQMIALRAEFKKSLEEAKQQYRQRYQQAQAELEEEFRTRNLTLNREKQQAVIRAKAQTQAYYQNMIKNARERSRASETKRKLKRLTESMERRLLKPTDTSYVPKELIKPVIEIVKMVSAVNGKNTATYQELKSRLDFLQKEYADFSKGLGSDSSGEGAILNYHYEENAQFAETISNLVYHYAQVVNDKSRSGLLNLSNEELTDIYSVMKELDHIISTAGKLIGKDKARYIHDTAGKVINELRTSNDKIARPVKGYFLSTLSPIRAARLMTGYKENSVFVEIIEDFDKGQDKALRIEQESDGIFRAIFNKYLQLTVDGEEIGHLKNKSADFKRKTALDAFAGKKAELVDVGLTGENGEKILITPAMRLSLLLHLENRDNFYHVMNGGLNVPDMKLYAKGKVVEAFSPGISVRGLDMQTLLQIMNRIHNEMSDIERDMYKACRYYFDTFSKDYMNETSLQLNGYKKATVDHYFPIATDKNYLVKEFDFLKFDYSIENAGPTHARRQGAKTPLLLEEVTNVIDRHTRFLSKYAGLAIPLRNFKAVYNSIGKGYSTSVKKVMQQYWGAAKSTEAANSNVFRMSGEQYIVNLLSDLQKSRSGDNMLTRFMSHHAGAVLTMNPGVTIKQAASYPTAAAVLGWKAVNKALVKGGKSKRLISRAGVELINKYSPYLWHRAKGYSIRELGDMRENDHGWENNRNLKALTGWIQAVDLATVGRIWSAAEYYVNDHYSGLKKGTDAYYKQVAYWFEKAVKETQPNYTVMQRPDVMRSNGVLSRVFTMFRTVPLQNFGALVDAVGEYRARRIDFSHSRTAENQASVKESFSHVCNVVSSQVVSSAVLALMTFIGNMLLHRPEYYEDENGEITVQSILTQYGKDTFSALASEPLFGSEICNWLLQSDPYDINLAAISTINKLYTGSSDLVNTASAYLEGDKSWDDVSKKLDRFITTAFEAFGVPAGNVKKIINAVNLYAQDIESGELFSSGREQSKSQVGRIMYQAILSGDREKYDYYKLQLQEEGKTVNQIELVVRNALAKNDPRIKQAALAMQSGDTAAMNRIIAQLAAAGFNRSTVISAVKSYYNSKLKKE